VCINLHLHTRQSGNCRSWAIAGRMAGCPARADEVIE